MRTASLALLLSLSLTVACSGEAPDAGESPAQASAPPAQEEAPIAAPAVAPPASPAPAAADSGAPSAEEGDAIDADAGAPDAASDGGLVIIGTPIFLVGGLRASEAAGETCHYFVDGVDRGTSKSLDITVFAGSHSVRCEGTNGRVATASVDVAVGETEELTLVLPPIAPPAGTGTLVAVAVGGSCAFSVNGASKGTSSQLKLEVPPGAYSVTCKTASGESKTRSVLIKTGETAMAMFKLTP